MSAPKELQPDQSKMLFGLAQQPESDYREDITFSQLEQLPHHEPGSGGLLGPDVTMPLVAQEAQVIPLDTIEDIAQASDLQSQTLNEAVLMGETTYTTGYTTVIKPSDDNLRPDDSK
ncbi:hypothetical protein HY468_02495 [Candidatus Roizmanbacteria bacterium]|nr:hypothetical protein [Candidatus Roizmanbacteria bacterium]